MGLLESTLVKVQGERRCCEWNFLLSTVFFRIAVRVIPCSDEALARSSQQNVQPLWHRPRLHQSGNKEAQKGPGLQQSPGLHWHFPHWNGEGMWITSLQCTHCWIASHSLLYPPLHFWTAQRVRPGLHWDQSGSVLSGSVPGWNRDNLHHLAVGLGLPNQISWCPG